MPSSDQGVDPARYALIPRTLIFLTQGERVLMLKGAPHKRLWANLYNGIGGHVERGEDILTAARRELFEETGFRVNSLWLCGVVTVDTGENLGIGIFVFKGEITEGEPTSSSEGTLEWVPVSEIQHRPLVEDLHILLPRVLAMKSGDPPFFAHYSYDMDERLVIRIVEDDIPIL